MWLRRGRRNHDFLKNMFKNYHRRPQRIVETSYIDRQDRIRAEEGSNCRDANIRLSSDKGSDRRCKHWPSDG